LRADSVANSFCLSSEEKASASALTHLSLASFVFIPDLLRKVTSQIFLLGFGARELRSQYG
jgi:hypothetical protein